MNDPTDSYSALHEEDVAHQEQFDTNEARIILAGAMGGPIWEAYIDPGKHPECVDLPDPFKCANDDYAVLEWMREKCGLYLPDGDYTRAQAQEFKAFGKQLDDSELYEIGDYARAALKVLE